MSRFQQLGRDVLNHDLVDGNNMIISVIGVACRRFKMKIMLFSCVLAHKCVLWGYNLLNCLLISQVHTNSISIKLELSISPKLVLRMCSKFSRTKLLILIVLFQIL